MSGLHLRLRHAPPRRLDLSELVPSGLAGMSVADIERLALAPDTRVGDLFAVTAGDAGDLTIEGGSEHFERLGAGLDGGTLRLVGSAGRLAGAGMTAGRLDLRGSAGDHAAAGLTGGIVDIAGDAGDDLAGPVPGERAGMNGGVVLVRGRAGDRAADRLRRGLVVVEGDSGDLPGSRMVAGTLLVCGRAGAHPGTLMRRGTIVLGPGSAPPGPTFMRTVATGAVFLSLLARHVLSHDCASQPAGALLRRELDRRCGDLATLGKGEVFVAGGSP